MILSYTSLLLRRADSCPFYKDAKHKASSSPAQEKSQQSLRRFFAVKGLRLPVGVGLILIGYLQYRRLAKEQREQEIQEVHVYPHWRVQLYRSYPLRIWSKFAGWLSQVYIPSFLRGVAVGGYAKSFGCRLDEAEISDVSEYSTLAQFFERRIKPECRPISNAPLVSPADGKILTYGLIEDDGHLEQVKGLKYALKDFLGSDLLEDLKPSKKARLYHMVVYLAPGDYHGFHSPTKWDVSLFRHFTGYLLSVRKFVVERVPEVFSLNERVLVAGRWQHGFFSMTAVGATHVGNIYMDLEDKVQTNRIRRLRRPLMFDDVSTDVSVRSGARVGGFRLGSSIVLIFEAPHNFQFLVQPGDTVKYGQAIGALGDAK